MKIYLVGGAVRDQLLNLPIKDRDWVIVGATKEILLKKNFQQVGKDFPVFLHPKTREEYALARKDRKLGKGYTDFHTDFSSYITLEEDLIRRDLTINAIAQDKFGNYIDPYQGKKDLENRLLRHVSQSFTEDPLRVLRTARFAAKLMHLGFRIATETMFLMREIVKKKELLYLTVNRIWNETEKAFKTKNPHVYLQVLYSCDALNLIFPEICLLYERELFFTNFFNHLNNLFLSQGLSKISTLTKDISIRFSYIFQFFSLNTNDIFKEKFYDQVSASIVQKFCNRLNIPTYIKEIAILSTGFHHFLNSINYQSSKNIVHFFCKIDAWRKPDRVKIFSFLSNFNFLNNISQQNRSNDHSNINLSPGFFLKKSFSVVQNISIKSILQKGFKGDQIKNELNRIRIKKLDLWRIKNFKKLF
ncbi:tRNA CCA-pyrophosphorylase [Buchnera aphidicola]|uniref:CCA-adding enzyme n=1 Tax=Buchnera aphidicola (Aphis gossypii) TaxID=98785 RepID=A0A5J6ZDB9_9GAMM|nr:tRNA CCA-pyrophosphorylase [Buchnera aphidicola]QFQ31915.1 tRNA CCA-pyrophosphorylase [Buchnera aphidicola (Aphis gossypii)]UPT14448.1 tRNA CCA-pyrophosphorylase [Buchnera aphidicola (Aphis gossypii)]